MRRANSVNNWWISNCHTEVELGKEYILKIDFGNDIGVKKTSAQITNYQLDELIGVRCIGVINLGDKQIGPIISQCLILGSINDNGDVLLLQPSPEADLGDKVS